MIRGLVHPIPPHLAASAAASASFVLKALVVLIHAAAAVVQVRLHMACFWSVDLSTWWPGMLGVLVTAGCLFALVFMEQVDGRQIGPAYVLGFNVGLVLLHVGLSVHWAQQPMGIAPDEPGWLARLHRLLDSAWLYWGLYPATLVANWIVVRRRSAALPSVSPSFSPSAQRGEPRGRAGDTAAAYINAVRP